MVDQPRIEREAQEHGYETTDVRIAGVLWTALGLTVTLLIIGAAVAIAVVLLRHPGPTGRSAPTEIETTSLTPPEPRLQVEPMRDAAELHTQAEQVLHSYGWVDRKGGIVRIPIERAERLLVDRGWPSKAAEGRQ